MPLKELDWVDYLKKRTANSKGVITGIGDDCAQVRVNSSRVLLKSDLFIEGVHFTRSQTSSKTIGMRAVARVLSDFAACAGIPKFIGISAGVPYYIKEKDLKEIVSGVLSYAEKYKFSLVGGDTSRAQYLFIDVWGVGVADKCVLRSTAQEGDYIFVSGKLGSRKLDEPFIPRIKEAQFLVKNFKINAMIDISDGFIIDLYRILKESRKGAVINSKDLPCYSGDNDLYRGEDYELIFTVAKREKRLEALKKRFHLVGRIKKSGYKIKRGSRLEQVKIKGYTHF